MVRASRLPFQNFEYNLRRAQALANLDGYLDDLLNNQGKGTIGVFLDLPNQLMKATGMDKVIEKVKKNMELEAKEQFKGKSEDEMKKLGEDMVSRIKPEVEKIAKMFEDLQLVMSATLTEQALVLGVSAFEVYLRDLVSDLVSRSPTVAKKFKQEIEAEFTIAKLEAYKDDAKRTKGEIVAETVKLQPNRIRYILKRLIGWEGVFLDKESERKFVRIVESRNLIIHRAGIIDPKFKRLTLYGGPIDKPLVIGRQYTLESLGFLSNLVGAIDERVQSKPGMK